MVPIEDLKKIYLMQRLTDSMLERVQPLVERRFFEDRDVIFKEGQNADRFFMLFKGKVLLEVEASEAIMISLGSVKPGYSFGWSALVPREAAYTSFAMCVEPCEVFELEGEKLLALLNEDHTMGYRIMEGVMNILKTRLERRTSQFLKTLRRHPDIQKPFWT